MGRFLSEDPTGFADGPNPYRYAGNDPVNFSDPTGLSQAGNPLNNLFGGGYSGGRIQNENTALRNPVNPFKPAVSTSSLINSLSGPTRTPSIKDFTLYDPLPSYDPLAQWKTPVATHSIPLIVADPNEVRRANSRINDPVVDILSSPRIQGAGRIAQAGAEYYLAAGLSTTGLGTPIALGIAAHATDTLNAGFQELVYGRPTETYGAQAIRTFANSSGLQPEAEGLAFAYDILPSVLAPLTAPKQAVNFSSQIGTGNFADDVIERTSTRRPGSVSNNPANQLMETGIPLKNADGWVKRWTRATPDDVAAQDRAIFERYQQVEKESRNLPLDQQHSFRFEQMRQFRLEYREQFLNNRNR